ncbi:MAG: radical SAM protein [Nitrospirota bacterium]
MKREICFIEARSPGLHVFSDYPIPRLGTVLLSTILKGLGYRTKAFIEDIAKPDWKEIETYDIVGISTITSTAKRAYKLADDLRAKGKTVIMGGPHPTFLPDEALEHSDYVVRGEGEETLVELLDAIASGSSLEDIRGLSFRTASGTIHSPKRELIADLDRHPAPDFSLVHGWTGKTIMPMATSRGCPFDCRFCSVIHMFGRKYRFKSIERILEELREAETFTGFVFFIDDNFTADKKRTKELLQRMISGGIRLKWSAQVRSDAAKDRELLRLMKKAGCTNVFVGFESINPNTLKLFNKKQGIEDIVEAVKAFHEHGIRIHGMFVLGSDTDDLETIRNTERFARKMRIESVQLMILTPLPGTPVYEEMKAEGRLLHTDWSKYDAHHTVYRPKLLTPSELQRETFKAMTKFYSWSKIINHLTRLNLYCGVLSYYGRRSVRRASEESERYLRELDKLVKLPLDHGI